MLQRPVLVREDLEHAGHGLRGLRVDRLDPALSDGARHHVAMCKVRGVELAGVFGGTGDLGAAVDTAARGSDVGFVPEHGG